MGFGQDRIQAIRQQLNRFNHGSFSHTLSAQFAPLMGTQLLPPPDRVTFTRTGDPVLHHLDMADHTLGAPLTLQRFQCINGQVL
ncbi:hypothetical protein Y958_20675 [Nitrospirillum viridazoti CBAmc]|uniref:Uncharacterized protein n=1 Tax=Nitrospirillum viridazoti CBAmc TaxID=1441467 RepID=A0A248JYM3_9PROT|nr:hypothetical protein Y958_20675 [Nitrospirillum amazonense CBAmc]